MIYCFTSTNDWGKFLEIKENLASFIKLKVEDIGLKFAFQASQFILKKLIIIAYKIKYKLTLINSIYKILEDNLYVRFKR